MINYIPILHRACQDIPLRHNPLELPKLSLFLRSLQPELANASVIFFVICPPNMVHDTSCPRRTTLIHVFVDVRRPVRP